MRLVSRDEAVVVASNGIELNRFDLTRLPFDLSIHPSIVVDTWKRPLCCLYVSIYAA